MDRGGIRWIETYFVEAELALLVGKVVGAPL
jgi:hypothetical protein